MTEAKAPEKREFKVSLADGSVVQLTTRAPTNQEMQDSEFQYSREFNRAIMNGIMPQSRLVAALTESGVWSPDDDKKVEAQRQAVVALEEKIAAAEGAEKGVIARSLAAERDKLFRVRQERNSMLSHSAEAKAQEAQRNFLVSRVTELSGTGSKVWSKFEDFVNEQDGGLVFRAVYEYLTFSNGLPSDFAAQLPENQVDEPAAPAAPEPAKAAPAPKEAAPAEDPFAPGESKPNEPKKVVAAGKEAKK